MGDTEELSKKHAWRCSNDSQIDQYRDNLDPESSNIKQSHEVMF